MEKGLLGPNGGSGGRFEGRFGEHCGGNGGIGGSMSGVGEGKDESMGGMGGGSLARRSMVSNDGRGGGGLVVTGRRSSRESIKGLRRVGAGGGEVDGGGVDLELSKRLLLLLLGDSCGIEVLEVGVPKVHESLKHTTEEHVLIENPPRSIETLSSMKNLEDNFTFCDQFLNDKSTKDELGKAHVETEVEYMVIVPIHQASYSAHPISTPVIDLLAPKPVSPHVQEPIFIAKTATTTTLPLPPPPSQQSTSDLKIASRVSTLEKICANFEKKHNL
ncbi:hypothetical protein Tco_0532448 [Tanacetum coccineum]